MIGLWIYILETELVGLINRLDVRCEEAKMKIYSKFLPEAIYCNGKVSVLDIFILTCLLDI